MRAFSISGQQPTIPRTAIPNGRQGSPYRDRVSFLGLSRFSLLYLLSLYCDGVGQQGGNFRVAAKSRRDDN